jgi:hypothetical protein
VLQGIHWHVAVRHGGIVNTLGVPVVDCDVLVYGHGGVVNPLGVPVVDGHGGVVTLGVPVVHVLVYHAAQPQAENGAFVAETYAYALSRPGLGHGERALQVANYDDDVPDYTVGDKRPQGW